MENVLRSVRDLVGAVSAEMATRAAERFGTGVRRDFERVTLFFVLFRSHADQLRLLDAADASLGVFLLALLTVAPFAFERAPNTLPDRIALGAAIAIVASLVCWALFGIRGTEENPTLLGVKLLLDLEHPVNGTLQAVRDEINRRAHNPAYEASSAQQVERGASGDLVQLIARDRQTLRAKRRLLGTALLLTTALAAIVGYRDVVHSTPEGLGRDGYRQSALGAIAAVAFPSGSGDRNPGRRPADVRPSHAPANLIES